VERRREPKKAANAKAAGKADGKPASFKGHFIPWYAIPFRHHENTKTPQYIIPDVPEFDEWKDEKYFRRIKDATLRARYHWAFDTCSKKSTSWSAKQKYKCFRLLWK
jgi:hypothetical protein